VNSDDEAFVAFSCLAGRGILEIACSNQVLKNERRVARDGQTRQPAIRVRRRRAAGTIGDQSSTDALESPGGRGKLKEDPDVLTAEEAAALLRVSTKTLLALAREGELPGEKVGRAWRFLRPELLGYLRGAGRSASRDRARPRP